jgi:hypothetical protein
LPQTAIARTCHPQSPSKRFEQRLDLVMIGAAIEHPGMYIGPRTSGKAFKKVMDQF